VQTHFGHNEVMTAATLSAPTASPQPGDRYDRIPLLVGGWVLGSTSVALCACLDALMIGTVQWLYIGPGNRFWPPEAVIFAGVCAAVLSFLVGYRLFTMRRWIGLKGDPTDLLSIRRKRRYFTVGSMCGYLTVTPFLWVVIVGLAFSTAQSPGTIQ
jgi:hypothetical protein